MCDFLARQRFGVHRWPLSAKDFAKKLEYMRLDFAYSFLWPMPQSTIWYTLCDISLVLAAAIPSTEERILLYLCTWLWNGWSWCTKMVFFFDQLKARSPPVRRKLFLFVLVNCLPYERDELAWQDHIVSEWIAVAISIRTTSYSLTMDTKGYISMIQPKGRSNLESLETCPRTAQYINLTSIPISRSYNHRTSKTTRSIINWA